MSMAMVAHVRSLSKSTHGARLLLLVIASHTSPTTGLAWPSIATLTTETGLSERHVCRLLQRLEALGELMIERRGGRSRSNRYRICVGTECSTGPTDAPRNSDISVSETLTFVPRNSDLQVRGKDEREKKDRPVAYAPEKPEMQHRFWCADCGYVIQACTHRVVEVSP